MMPFCLIALTAAVLSHVLSMLEQQGEALVWSRLVQSAALPVALVEVSLDLP